MVVNVSFNAVLISFLLSLIMGPLKAQDTIKSTRLEAGQTIPDTLLFKIQNTSLKKEKWYGNRKRRTVV